ncbi:hypothetical protein HME7025_00074 [Aquirufa nivalisilvae]|uniref:Uncharacterized protein n=1 Tax=Aquirufa nivalisilvae TaxID=2516557 RepID=A0A2S2DRM7_9BACT|nr:hypothetical protein [Aquirufa nivalisilvae]AWL07959.1 hypothetical protein HME7025_00074 [Aquirufa nivalisilvae]
MSNPKYTPMQILRDNIKREIINTMDTKNLERGVAYLIVLKMIEGDSLGKPLLEQEIECLERAYQFGINTPDLINEAESYCDLTFTLVPIFKQLEKNDLFLT